MMVGMMLIGTSCRKKSASCSCGEIVEVYRNNLDGSKIGIDFLQMTSSNIKVSVKNYCSDDLRDFSVGYEYWSEGVLGTKFCDPKGNKW